MKGVLQLYREAFTGLPREAWLIALAAFVNRAGTMVMVFLVVWLAEVHGLSSGRAAMFMSLWGVGALVGVHLGGRLCDRIGAVPVQVLSFVGAACGFMALPGLFDLPLIGGTIFLIGLLGESFRPANSALLAAVCGTAVITRAFALHRLAINLGWAIGPMLGGVISEYVGWDLVFRLDAATCVLSGFLMWMWFGRASVEGRGETEQPDDDGPGRSPWSDPTVVLLCTCTLGLAMAFIQFLSTVPEYLRQSGWGKDDIGFVEAINPILIVAFEMILVHRLERPNPLRVMAVGGLCTTLGFLMLGWSTSFLWIATFVVLTTFGEMLDAPFASSYVAARAPRRSRGRYMGLYALAFSSASILGPAGGGFIVESFGWDTLWPVCAVLAGTSTLGFLLLAGRIDRESRE